MLELRNISKTYTTGELKQKALDNVSVSFRDSEFAAILGPSGSGKTTLLNIIGGLDKYDDGDLLINAKSTKEYKDRDWDTYRNNTIGFVFQSYNLIGHQTILDNVKIALTISGISEKESLERAKEALIEVGLEEHMHKLPNQLSGGQMQRVAIARALVNNPDILLADEPTGALDTDTGIQIMELLSKVAEDRLVIMVTHNPALAKKYANRIIRLKDGRIIDDTNSFNSEIVSSDSNENIKKTSMKFKTALKLSYNNLKTKKKRTIMTSIAGSIGIIGIALILSMSSGVNIFLSNMQRDTLSTYPIVLHESTVDMRDFLDLIGLTDSNKEEKVTHRKDKVYATGEDFEYENKLNQSLINNDLSKFKQYIESSEGSEINNYVGTGGIVYNYSVRFDTYTKDSDNKLINCNGSYPATMDNYSEKSSDIAQILMNKDNTDINQFVLNNYTVLSGDWPHNYDEIVLVLDVNNEISAKTLYRIGILPFNEYTQYKKQLAENTFEGYEMEEIDYDSIVGKEYAIVPLCDYFILNEDGETYTDVTEDISKLDSVYEKAIKVKISGVVRPKIGADSSSLYGVTLGYSSALTDYLLDYISNNELVQKQLANNEVNAISNMLFSVTDTEQKIEEVKKYVHGLDNSRKVKFLDVIINEWLNNSELGLFGLTPEAFKEQVMESNNMSENYIAQFCDIMIDNGLSEIARAASEEDSENEKYVSEIEKSLVLNDDVYINIYDKYISAGSFELVKNQLGIISKDRPSSIEIYVDTFKDKEAVLDFIDSYNETQDEDGQIQYIDYFEKLIHGVTRIIDIISYILIAFVAVSLIVSSIMIGIVTFISVLERTKEIGILRALGASKTNIAQVFNAETILIGLLSGIMGIITTNILLIPINYIIHLMAKTTKISAVLPIHYALMLICLSMLLTFIGGFIPARGASKKDPVTALRAE